MIRKIPPDCRGEQSWSNPDLTAQFEVLSGRPRNSEVTTPKISRRISSAMKSNRGSGKSVMLR